MSREARSGLLLSVLAVAAAVAIIALPVRAAAVCGDVNGDGEVLAADALRVLRRSVGQNVPMTCTIEVENYMGFSNTLTCNGNKFTAYMTWSEHPSLTWSSYSQTTLPINSDFERVDDLYIGGSITVTLGSCGTRTYDIDANEVVYPMPPVGAASVHLAYQASDDRVYFFMSLIPAGTSAGVENGDEQLVTLGSIPAPPGIGSSLP